jgi:hypothetical protein
MAGSDIVADYKRMVSYMYIYENGVKKKNAGYARIEERDGECKITLHMQLPGLSDSIFPTYLIQRKSDNLELVYLGDSILKNQVMDSKHHTGTLNVMGSGYDMSDMGGILLFLDENTFFATEWDDKPVILHEILEALKPAGRRAAAVPAMAADADNSATFPLYKLPRGWKIIERRESERAGTASDPWDLVRRYIETQMDKDGQTGEATGEQAEEPDEVLSGERPDAGQGVSVSQPEEDLKGKPDAGQGVSVSQPEEDLKGKPDAGQGVSVSQPEEDLKGKPDAGPGEALISFFDKYPRIYPFEDNEIALCVKIEPKDIGGLPADAWVLSNNSFLLHGFYCYHHLIFAKLKEGFGTGYILGVPGIYHNRERIMARMFGFSNFKSIKRSALKQGDFGYWYMPIKV